MSHPASDEAHERVVRADATVRFLAKYIARCLSVYPFPSEPLRVGRRRASRPPQLTADVEAPPGRHELITIGGRLRCTRCLCSGTRLQDFSANCDAGGASHRLWKTGRYVFCAACCCSKENTRGLAQHCRGGVVRGSATAFRLERLWESRDPRDGALVAASRPVPFGAALLDAMYSGLHVLPPS